eukprot:CAMPEP_0178448710 /NCGR_PEP_ID=MMETSP0689_2-20121128/42138_1 /TAXON_ID=160604 /ORGANISM="Amphidinium massartii, Strain CS-259" /LENGTH=162 /DNA_ID=CAMNT_0020073931 /DNA_START=11 /DNA_END=502 /DNA_ORIENTATION=-
MSLRQNRLPHQHPDYIGCPILHRIAAAVKQQLHARLPLALLQMSLHSLQTAAFDPAHLLQALRPQLLELEVLRAQLLELEVAQVALEQQQAAALAAEPPQSGRGGAAAGCTAAAAAGSCVPPPQRQQACEASMPFFPALARPPLESFQPAPGPPEAVQSCEW